MTFMKNYVNDCATERFHGSIYLSEPFFYFFTEDMSNDVPLIQ